MDWESHQSVDRFFYGKDVNYVEVHKWLDETVWHHKDNPYKHWLDTHHKEAIYKKYGSYTIEYNVSYLHILTDYLAHFQIAEVPQNKQDTEILLKSIGVI